MTSELQKSIENQHGGRAVFRAIEPVDERYNGRPAWQGDVHVFDLEGHPKATRAYAWSSPVDGSDPERSVTDLLDRYDEVLATQLGDPAHLRRQLAG